MQKFGPLGQMYQRYTSKHIQKKPVLTKTTVVHLEVQRSNLRKQAQLSGSLYVNTVTELRKELSSKTENKNKWSFKMNQQTGKIYFIVMTELLSCDNFCSLRDCFLSKKFKAKT